MSRAGTWLWSWWNLLTSRGQGYRCPRCLAVVVARRDRPRPIQCPRCED